MARTEVAPAAGISLPRLNPSSRAMVDAQASLASQDAQILGNRALSQKESGSPIPAG